jgi:putative Ca2+/H+ antiporter (TMEM165/GDT1 family)
MFGAEGSGGASSEFEEITEDCNLMGWKLFDQLQPNKKSWIVSSLLAFQGYARDEIEAAMKANSPLPDTDIEAIVEFIFQVSEAYTALLEHVSFIDSAVWEVKSASTKKSKSVSNKDKEEAFKSAFSELGLLE